MRRIKAAVGIPVVAIGGVSHANAAEVLRVTGADGLAVVSSIFDTEDVAGACAAMMDAIGGAMRERAEGEAG